MFLKGYYYTQYNINLIFSLFFYKGVFRPTLCGGDGEGVATC